LKESKSWAVKRRRLVIALQCGGGPARAPLAAAAGGPQAPPSPTELLLPPPSPADLFLCHCSSVSVPAGLCFWCRNGRRQAAAAVPEACVSALVQQSSTSLTIQQGQLRAEERVFLKRSTGSARRSILQALPLPPHPSSYIFTPLGHPYVGPGVASFNTGVRSSCKAPRRVAGCPAEGRAPRRGSA
jgi:hypothetical protein